MESYSSRIKKFSISEEYTGDSGEFSFLVDNSELKATFFYKAKRGILSHLSYIPNEARIENGILYALCKLLTKADLERVKLLSAREVESFLRDENHIPSMGEKVFPAQFVELFKNLLIASVFEEEIASDLEYSEVGDNATYVDKINAISDFFTLKVNMGALFTQENMEIELIQLESTACYVSFYSSINKVKMAPNTLSKELLSAIERLVRSVIKTENINLVAE